MAFVSSPVECRPYMEQKLRDALNLGHPLTVENQARSGGETVKNRKILAVPDAVIRVYDDVGNVIGTHEHKGDFKET